MDTNNNIIAIRKRDITLAHQAFVELMSRTENILNEEAQSAPDVYKRLTSSTLESQLKKSDKLVLIPHLMPMR